MRIRLAPMPVLTVFTVLAFALLVWLGSWQWGRYKDKQVLLSAPPQETTLTPFTPMPDRLQLVFGVTEGVSGWRVFEPVRYGERIVFVDTGFIPAVEPPDWRTVKPSRELETARAVTGIVVHPRTPSAMVPKARESARVWFWANLEGMGRAAGLGTVETYYVALPYLSAAGQPTPNPFALAARKGLPPPQHLGYALTWWGLAAALIGVYLAFHARQGRLSIR